MHLLYFLFYFRFVFVFYYYGWTREYNPGQSMNPEVYLSLVKPLSCDQLICGALLPADNVTWSTPGRRARKSPGCTYS